LAVAKSDGYLKNAVLRFVEQEFREDLKKMLGISFADIVLHWDEGTSERPILEVLARELRGEMPVIVVREEKLNRSITPKGLEAKAELDEERLWEGLSQRC